jgi:hypothetical protein
MPSRRFGVFLVLAAIGWQTGCGDKGSFRPDAQPSPPSSSASKFPGETNRTPNSAGPSPVTRYHVQFDVLRVEVPRGFVSGSEILWNHVDESVLLFEVARRLRLNGFRIGLAERGAWPAIKAILDGCGAAQAMQAGLGQADLLPVTIELDPISRDQTVLHYGPGGKLQGATFADSLNMLRIEHQLDAERLGEFTVRLTPEVRKAHLQTTFAATEAGLREVPVYQGRLFTDLAVEISVPDNCFIVVGPSNRAWRRALIGTDFLCTKRGGVEYERLLFITPRLVTNSPSIGRPLPIN